MKEAILSGKDEDLEEISQISPVSPIWRWVGWAIPTLIVGALGYIGVTQGVEAASDNAVFWFLINAVPCAIGGMLAFAHPITIAAGFASAPFTSLTPVIGAGYVTAFVQTWVSPPLVHEFHSVGDDIATVRGWWSSRLLRVFLTFILTTLGSLIGTWVGGSVIVTRMFQ